MNYWAVTPMAKPRMTRSDKWNKRDCVLRYRAYKDELRLRQIDVPDGGVRITFVLPMPASWSKKKRAEMINQPHQQTPDVDNLHKGLLDALFVMTARFGITGSPRSGATPARYRLKHLKKSTSGNFNGRGKRHERHELDDVYVRSI